MNNTALPQHNFKDVYTVAYDVLDDAKQDHRIVKLYKGSHLSTQPHEYTLNFGAFFAQKRQGLFSFACSMVDPAKPPEPSMLKIYDALYNPPISLSKVFRTYYSTFAKPNETSAELFRYVCSRQHKLGAYRGGSSGLEDETLAFMCEYFKAQGFELNPSDVLVFGGGFKGAMLAFCAALFCYSEKESLHGLGGTLLVPQGYYQSLRLMPPLFSAKLSLIKDMTGVSIDQWLAKTSGEKRRAIYIPLVNNANGAVLTRPQALQIAEVILTYNAQHPDNPVYVLGDDVYIGSYLQKDLMPQPVGAINGKDFGKPQLGSMLDWSLSIITSSKTFALPTSRISFAVTKNKKLRAALSHYRSVFSHSRVPQYNELTAVAAICLTPLTWIEQYNNMYRQRLERLAQNIEGINHEFQTHAFELQMPQGGWYAPLKIAREFLPRSVNSNIAALSILLNYGVSQKQSGLGMLSGELFGYLAHKHPDDMFTMRGSVAVSDTDLAEFTARLRAVALAMTGPQRDMIAHYCRKRLYAVAPDIDQILNNLTY
jgi:aspartate/methionine/tyrosine aminotransferase